MGFVAVSTGLELSERAELDWLLESGALGRSLNLTKVLRYVCEETAAGRGDQLKEYSIAVEALGRKPNFDPQTDTIVRVTFHTLRKRLQELYEAGEGASHPVRIFIPTGGYAAQFVHALPSNGAAASGSIAHMEGMAAVPGIGPASSKSSSEPPKADSPRSHLQRRWLPWFPIGLVAVAIVFVLTTTLWRTMHRSHAASIDPVRGTSPVVINGPAYILFGSSRRAYTDHSGVRWEPQPACEGGEDVSPTHASISGTEDSYIYDGGLRGIVRCTFRARPGLYELRLHFAEPSDLEPAHRVVSLQVNAKTNVSVDVVDRAGGDRAATTYSIPGVSPENDGTIHLDFTSEVSPVNAIEILPALTADPLPLRIVASSKPYKDEHGNLWMSDQYFHGGRHGQPPDQEHRPSLGLYASGRIGTFAYSLPAPTGSKYRVTLYFREPWFGQENGAPGGPGSRVFDVICNGQTALRNFDILAQATGSSVVKTIEDVSPTAQGVVNLEFVPVVNYPIVNAIEVVSERP